MMTSLYGVVLGGTSILIVVVIALEQGVFVLLNLILDFRHYLCVLSLKNLFFILGIRLLTGMGLWGLELDC